MGKKKGGRKTKREKRAGGRYLLPLSVCIHSHFSWGTAGAVRFRGGTLRVGGSDFVEGGQTHFCASTPATPLRAAMSAPPDGSRVVTQRLRATNAEIYASLITELSNQCNEIPALR